MDRFYRQGEVIAVRGDEADVQLSISGFCSGTHKCAQTAFIKGLTPDRNRMRAKNNMGAEIGEKVIIEIISPGFYRSLFFVFLLPLIALFLGILSGIQLAGLLGSSQKSDLYAGIGAIVFFSVSLFVSRFINQRVHPQYLVHHRMNESRNCENCSLMLKQ